ncbi:MAG: SDR family NAD(P)-dependent oxidoreductase [Candidatus Obscuribacterales bacterium]|nr:SDR family NAD(P)-dependent oxidoreductase [Candidatus Obscuribacterales bacterium]
MGELLHVQTPEFGIIALTPAAWPGTLEDNTLALAAARAGETGIFNLEFGGDPLKVKGQIVQALAAVPAGKFGIRCHIEDLSLFTVAIETLTQAKNAKVVLLISSQTTKKTLSSAITALQKKQLAVFCEVISQKEAELSEACGANAIIAKGHESAGRVGEETSFILLQRCLKTVKIPVWLHGGIGQHTVAAAYVGGAAGVVLDSQLLLFPESALAPEQVEKLSQFDGSETVLLQSGKEEFFRLWSKIGIPELADLQKELKEGRVKQSLHKALNTKSAFPLLLPLGQDIALSANLLTRYGTAGAAIRGLKEAAINNASLADKLQSFAEHAPLAVSHQTKYPIVQGAMTRVSDTADFAASVAKGGGLPFLALALMRQDEIDPLLKETAEKLKDRPWGVGILGFVPQELRQEQLKVIEKYRPPFALIAGGRPDQAKHLETLGIQTYLHVPSPLLLKSFVETGSRRFIFEGKECGGHVGPRSSFVLWDSMIEALLQSISPKDNPEDFHIIFAGGIHNDLSAAMVAALAAPLAARGIRIGMLMGTAYLLTDEAVTTGAIVEKFQKAVLSCDHTVLLETGPGHAIRCIDSPYKETFDNQRQKLEAETTDRNEVRQELEMMNLGRLRIASKGLTRGNGSGGSKLVNLSEESQWSDGMYMVGQVAALHEQKFSIADLHSSVTSGSTKHLNQFKQETISFGAQTSEQEPIAIVGMSCLFPKANDLEAFWENILNSVDCIEEVPAEHWDWTKLYDKDPLARDKISSKWGGFLKDIPFDPSIYGIPPSSLISVDPMQLIILEVTRAALADAGYNKKSFNKERTSVILANAGHGPITAFYSLRSMLDWTLSDLPEEYRKQLEKRLPEWTEDSFPGYLGNVTAGRITNRFDLGGINFCVDAACASSLAALYVGINELRSKTSDAVLLASTDTHNQPGDYLSFSKTHALSPRGRCRTFDATADGIVISEGMAVLMLKRLSDAERDGDRIYAVIRGIGGSSDGRDLSLTAPRPAGQMLALKRAYQDAGISPASVELIEAHGTGTVAGDKAEVEALSKTFTTAGAKPESCAIGSVKSMIGHTKCSAGLASVIKVAKSLYHKVLPPTLGVETPNPSCNFETSPFYINSEARPWLSNPANAEPRRAGISAFGFGGTNFHTVLEEYRGQRLPEQKSAVKNFPSELFVFRAADSEMLLKLLSNLENQTKQAFSAYTLPQGPLGGQEQNSLRELSYRNYFNYINSAKSGSSLLSIVAKSHEDLLAKIETSKQLLKDSSKNELRDPRGIFYNKQGSGEAPAIAMLFPGQGSQRVNMLKELSLAFPEIGEIFEKADQSLSGCFSQPLSRFVYAKPVFNDEERKKQNVALTNTHVAQPAVAAADLAALRILQSFGLKADVLAGHSFGEYVALAAAGSLTESELFKIAERRGQILAKTNGKNQGSMSAVSGPAALVQKLLENIPDVSLANINSPKQCIIAGEREALVRAGKILNENKLACQPISVSAAFHSPLMLPVQKELSDELKKVSFKKPQHQVISNTYGLPYPNDPANIAELLSEHAVKPVEFQRQIEKMYADGVKIFVECGPGSVLSNLVSDILDGKEHLAVSLERSGRHSLTQLQMLLGQLHTAGVEINFSPLFKNRLKPILPAEVQTGKTINKNKLLYLLNSAHVKKADGTMLKPRETNNTDSPMSANSQDPSPAKASLPKAIGSQEEMLLEFQRNMFQMTQSFIESQERVMLAYLQNGGTNIPNALPPINTVTATAEIPASEVSVTPATQPAPAETQSENNSAFNPEALITSLVEIVSERTGYPPEMLDPTLDLEADLGIDSIKRVEILNNFRKLLPEEMQLNLESSVEKLAGTKTLQGIMDWIRNDLPNQQAGDNSKTEVEEQKVPAPQTVSNIGRGLVRLRKLNELSIADNPPKGTYVITDDGKGTAEELAALLASKGNTPVIIKHQSETKAEKALAKEKFLTVTSNLSDYNDIEKTLSLIEAKAGQLTGILHLFPLSAAADAEEYLAVSSTFALSKALQTWLHHSESNGNQPLVILAAVSMDGGFGHSGRENEFNPTLGGVTGILKTISREQPKTWLRTIDFAPGISAQEQAGALCLELSDKNGLLEVGYSGGKRYELYVDNSPLPVGADLEQIKLDTSSVILVTGGARGITAELCLGLAKRHKPTFVILGRGQRPQQAEPKEFQGLTTTRELKAAIMDSLRAQGEAISIPAVENIYQSLIKEREIRHNLERLETSGARVKYYALDVRNEADFKAIINRLYDSFGRIDGVIHGAGVIEDALIKDKTPESFERVYRTKMDSAITLSKNLQLDSLQFLVFFSSVVGRTGNAGQSDYVAANESLNKLALLLNKKTKGKVSSIMWGPWRGGMAQDALEPVFAKYGWSMIEAQPGWESFEKELFGSNKNEVEVLLVGQSQNQNLAPTSGARLDRAHTINTGKNSVEYTIKIDPEFDLYLKDHTFDGTPVLPMAVALELMSEAAQNLRPDWYLASVDNLSIPAGIMFEIGAKDLVIKADAEEIDDKNLKVMLSINSKTSGQRKNFTAEATLTKEQPPLAAKYGSFTFDFNAPQLAEPLSDVPSTTELYQKWLFHGPLFQGIDKIESLGVNGIWGELDIPGVAECLKEWNGQEWIVDPILLDSAMQFGGVWARQYMDITALPTGFKSIRRVRPARGNHFKAVVSIPHETKGSELICDLAVYDASGKLVLYMEQLSGVGSKSLNRLSSQPKVVKAVSR